MPTYCAIFKCPSQHQKDGNDINFFRFPKEERLQQIWAEKCGPRRKPINPKTAYICSLHFAEHDYDQSQLMRRKLMGCHYRLKLNRDAVPTLCLPSAKIPETKNAISQHEGSKESGETVIEIIDQCRICLGAIRNNSGSNIFEEMHKDELLSSIMANLANVEVVKGDGLPNSICQKCRKKLHETYSFRTLIRKSDAELRNRTVLHVIHQEDVAVDDFDNQDETVIIVEEEPPVIIVDEQPPHKELRKPQKPPELDVREDGEFRVSHNVKRVRIRKRASRQTDENHICLECGKILKTRISLANHMQTHKKERHVCPKCGAVFKQSRYLQTHVQNHTKPKTFRCDRCPKTFLTNFRLKLHGRVHSDEKAYVCETCGKGFRFRTGLVSHMFTHDPEWYECEVCGKQFKQKDVLRVHMKTAHPVGGRLMCEHCGRTFKNHATLRRHVRRRCVQALDKQQVEKPKEELLSDDVVFDDTCSV